MFLGEFGGRVDVARVGRRVLGDEAGAERGAALRAGRLEAAGVQVGGGARTRADGAVPGAVVPPFAVDHHRPGDDQVPHTRRRHLGEQHRRPEVVAADVRRGVRELLAHPDHRRLVAHRVDPGQRRPHPLGVAQIRHDGRRLLGPVAAGMGGGQQRVEHHRLVPGRRQLPYDLRSDEPGSAGDQYAHEAHARRRAAGRGEARGEPPRGWAGQVSGCASIRSDQVPPGHPAGRGGNRCPFTSVLQWCPCPQSHA